MNEFLRRYQPVQVLRFRDSYGLGLNQAVTWYPFSHVGLFARNPEGVSAEALTLSGLSIRPVSGRGPDSVRYRSETSPTAM
jgi:hypothetical protein